MEVLISSQAKDKHGMTLEWDLKALEFLVRGYDINYGARSIKHEVERRVVNQLAVAHEYNLIQNGSHILITAELPPSQNQDVTLKAEKDAGQKAPESKNYDIRIKKRVQVAGKTVYEDINLKMNSTGKYFLDN